MTSQEHETALDLNTVNESAIPHLGNLPDLANPPKVENLNLALTMIENWAANLEAYLSQYVRANRRIVEAIDRVLSACAASGHLIETTPEKQVKRAVKKRQKPKDNK